MKVLRQITSCILHASVLIVAAVVKAAPTSAYTYDNVTTIIRPIAASVSPVVRIGFSDEPNARVDGRLFNIDGKTQYFAGTNTYWLGYVKKNTDVDLALQQLQSTLVPEETLSCIIKTYLFLRLGIARLDYVVSAAEKQGFKLVVAMLNNWDDLGGINSYTNAFGGNATTFFTDAPSQAAYKNYVSFIVNRYKNSPAIFAWELCNEPRCHGCPTSVITNWASDVSAHIKSLDPTHMVALGDEGWFAPGYGDGSYAYSGLEGIDFIKNLAIPTLDYGTFHLYPDHWNYAYSWGDQWIQQHDAVGKALGKPIVLEEYGSVSPGNHIETEGPWQQIVLQNSSIASDSFWQFGPPHRDLTIAVDDYSIDADTADYDILVKKHAAAMLEKTPMPC
ncbi:hypothetical protein MMC29_007463 [Sticta canariensis]|nr:hypothetical protein [Sticta canariensis]